MKRRADAYRQENGLSDAVPLPVDAVTASASGLDSEISRQMPNCKWRGMSRARGLSTAHVQSLASQHTQGRTFGILGEPRVNVLELNLALDAAAPQS